ncbi:unnamed protein product [Ambrosiozyma monospora]|uniref:Unnamed protein product n=1 Tax=Ambrosiozyma monospora TaxID=43982 RepID=A0A9W6YPF9_AMBMO|nr:unnamed protein product [Ambrosiozyma monospora]
MDNLGKTLNNLSLYEVKAYVRKAQNAVLNLSEIESKVREATNNEPWGASTSLMAEIARGTFNYRDREEICSMIFRRFTEKSAHEWRQIYKALQLMEYLVKNGSERFIDDARANVNLVSMLKSFHYTDSKGVDQGINVRNRAKELTLLLNDESKIRQERKKAKDNAKKFGAVSSNSYRGSSSSRYGGSSSSSSSATYDDEGYTGRVFGDGGVYGQRFEQQQSSSSSRRFEEYDVEGSSATSSRPSGRSSRRSSKPSVATSKVNARSTTTKKATTQQPVQDLFSFDDVPATTTTTTTKTTAAVDDDDDDEFDDFITAAPSSTTPAAAAPAQTNNLADLLSSAYTPSATTPQPQASFGQQPVQQQQQTLFSQSTVNTPAVSQPKKTDDLFGSLLMSAKTKAHTNSNSISSASPYTSQAKPSASTTANDDLFGSFASNPATTAKPAPAVQQSKPAEQNGVVDLLSF